MSFVHLKATTEFSISKSINIIPNVIKKAQSDSMGAVAITDSNGLFGAVAFYKEARKKGLKPIIGLDASIQQEDGNAYSLTLLAKNQNGYKKLIELNSRAYVENRSSEFVAAKEEWLADLEDVIVLSGGKDGLIGQFILKGDIDGAKEVAQQMKDFFGSDFYVELQRDGSDEEAKYMDGAIAICSELSIPPVATHPNYFTERDDFLSHEARYCIASKQSLYDIKRTKPFNKEMYFKTQSEMEELFADIPEALDNTVAIARKCNVELSLDEPKLPIFPTPDGSPIDDYFEQIAKTGLAERLAEDFPETSERDAKREPYEKRLNWEIDTIKKMGFPGYFLIVSDFITWAKEHDIPVGPGRGSGAGSLVAYSMKITDIDPLRYNLLFERFLNPERVSMPDFDIDFCQTRRGEVYDYVRQKYGNEAVCQIGTFGTMAAKAVIRDVGRTLEYPIDFVDTLAKLVNISPANPITLKQFIFGDDDAGVSPDEKMLSRYNDEPDVRKLIDIALRIEGVTRQLGTHAAGVVIAPTVLTDFTPLYTADENSTPATQFNMKDVESSGLVKFDFLGLRNLTIIKDAVDLINERKVLSGEPAFELRKIPIDDNEVYQKIYSNGNTIGIFQFEGSGMTAVIQKAQPSKIEDLIAINALYRPGPMDIIPDWLTSKSLPEEQRQYPDPRLKDVLSETYGYMIYQEQVMQCAQIIAGYSLGGADLLRRAMGKKKPEEMAKQRSVFIEGAGKNGMDAEKASHLFDLIEKFSGYGFNKSHAAAYSYLSYQTAYLKCHHAAEFFSATLNSYVEHLNTDKIAVMVDDAKRNGLSILPIDVNKSEYKFAIEDDKAIRYGFGALKGAGEKAALSIIQERDKNGEFVDFYDFLERCGGGSVNKRIIEALIKGGAFDSLNSNRAQLFESVAEGLSYVVKYRKQKSKTVSVLGDALYDDFRNENNNDSASLDDPEATAKKRPKKPKKNSNAKAIDRPNAPTVEQWDELSKLKNEKSVLGYFFSSNPYATVYSKQLGGLESAIKLNELQNHYYNGNQEAFVGCLIEDVKWWKSKKGAFVNISDGTTTVEVRMFSDFLNENKEWLKPDAFASLKIKLSAPSGFGRDSSPSAFAEGDEYAAVEEEESLSISVQQGFSLEQTMNLTVAKTFVGAEDSEESLDKFKNICQNHQPARKEDGILAILCVPNDENGRRNVKKSEFHVKPSSKLFSELSDAFGEEWVKHSFKKNIDNISFPVLPSSKKSGRYANNKKPAFSN